ncbi:putative quinol monooxygenase [Chondrinema litorale]|uniref:putative quinol monooxygenase n=1 Tax=Chondrinema litorale TaxID=2994555 RepID=UPI002543196B|nr:putative quinol monooxygenase [Chondrinema litorale]UZR96828.1 putative quinol monooxygenase [Chondrinema litorale]
MEKLRSINHFKISIISQIIITFTCITMLISGCNASLGINNPIATLKNFEQHSDMVIRFAKLEIKQAQLNDYETYLKEGIETAIAKEPGVLTMYALQNESEPSKITILEIYENDSAYQAHIESAHFQKYKTGTLEMVKSLELIDLNPIVFGVKTDN